MEFDGIEKVGTLPVLPKTVSAASRLLSTTYDSVKKYNNKVED